MDIKQPVPQRHLASCSVACVAYVLQIDYSNVLKAFDKRVERFGAEPEELIKALESFNREANVITNCNKDSVIEKDIVHIKKCEKYPCGHWQVYAGHGLWMNPWFNFPTIIPVNAIFESELSSDIEYVVRIK